MDPIEGEGTVTELPPRPAASISERAEEGTDAQDQLPGVPPLEGDRQLTLAGLGPRGMAIESEVSVMSAAVPVTGLLDPDKRGQLLVAYVPSKYEYVPVREGDRVVRWKLRQAVRPAHVIAANGVEAVEAVVMNAVQAGVSVDEIRAAVETALEATKAA